MLKVPIKSASMILATIIFPSKLEALFSISCANTFSHLNRKMLCKMYMSILLYIYLVKMSLSVCVCVCVSWRNEEPGRIYSIKFE